MENSARLVASLGNGQSPRASSGGRERVSTPARDSGRKFSRAMSLEIDSRPQLPDKPDINAVSATMESGPT